MSSRNFPLHHLRSQLVWSVLLLGEIWLTVGAMLAPVVCVALLGSLHGPVTVVVLPHVVPEVVHSTGPGHLVAYLQVVVVGGSIDPVGVGNTVLVPLVVHSLMAVVVGILLGGLQVA